ncbi:MAG: zinc ABC transporter substrate-binding protein, partial [Verrucomicrobiota bacterium]
GNFFVKVGDGVNAPRAHNLLEGLELLEGSCETCASHGEHADHAEHGEESEEHHHAHDHGDLMDPHVWLSPAMLTQQAQRIASILKEHTPDEANDEIATNLANLEADLAKVDAELKTALAPLKGQTFYVYHGAFAYFAQAYGLEQKAIEVNGREPTPKQVAEIAKQAKEDGVKLIFVQPQFAQTSAMSLAETIGGQVHSLDPLERDVIANLHTIAEAIQMAK